MNSSAWSASIWQRVRAQTGISRAAKVPTGWEVVLDLIDRVAAMEGADVAGDQVGWYEETFGDAADYSKILAKLARQRDKRQRILREYFEPSDDDGGEGVKQSTAAHRAITSLCRRKYIREIVTTNFDRLLEQALIAGGLQPTVIRTADAVKGAPPLAHADLLIVKVYGDYLDTRIRNTTGELESYPKPLERLLDRCVNQRYSTFWTGMEEPHESVQNLPRLRRAELRRSKRSRSCRAASSLGSDGRGERQALPAGVET